MQKHARVVVVGGGCVGAGILYGLARRGWTDVALIEKNELTSGSTWHAAGGMHTFNGDANVSKLQKYTIDLYRELEELTGQSCGIHANGGLMLAANEGELALVLRNPLDVDPAATKGIKLAALMRGTGPEPVLDAPKRKMVPLKKEAAPAPQAPQIYKVEAIRAAKRTEETVN